MPDVTARPYINVRQNARVDRFLDLFFSSPNRLTRVACAAASGNKAAKFSPWLDRLYSPEPIVTVLPRWNHNNSFDWYGLATDALGLRRLGEELMAFVGPTWSTFRGAPTNLDPADSLDKAVAEFAGGRGLAFKFTGSDPGRIFESLEAMRRMWDKRSPVTADAPRPVGRVLRDFYMALRADNRISAEEQLAYLGRRGHLNELNRLFLRVQMLDELGEPSELLSLAGLKDLLQVRRPLAVTQALLGAVYAKEIASVETDPSAALRQFEAIGWQYATLFSSEIGIRKPAAMKLFMLRAAAVGDTALRDRLMAVPADDNLLGVLRAFARLFPIETTTIVPLSDPLAMAAIAMDAGDFGSAFTLARGAGKSLRRAVVLCHCAYEAPSLEAEQEALEAIFSLAAADFEAVMRRRLVREYVEAHTAATTSVTGPTSTDGPKHLLQPPVTNWVQWLEALYAGALQVTAVEIARQGGEQWDPARLACDDIAIARLAKLLAGPPERWANAVNEALPQILEFFQRDPEWPRKSFGPVYGAAATVLAYTTAGALDDLTLFNDLMAACIETGASKAEYLELLEELRMLVANFAAPATLDWMLDALEILAFHPCSDDTARTDLLGAVGTQFYNHHQRVTADQRWLLGRLHAEMHQADLFANLLPKEEESSVTAEGQTQPGPEDPLLRYARQSIAIYTLNDRAAQVVSELLQDRVPGVKVHTNNDLAGTPRLKMLAQQADVFVMTLGSAKHAATDFIAANRPPGKPLLRTGKRSRGSSGVIQQLVKYVFAS